MPNRLPTRTLLWFALLSVPLVFAQTASRPLAQLAPAESFVTLGFNAPFKAPATRLQADLKTLDFPRAGRTLQKLSELSSDSALQGLLGQYSSLFQGAEGQLKRQQQRMGNGNKFTRCLEASTPNNLETMVTPEGAYSALLSVGASSYNPIPAATALLRVAPGVASQFAEGQRLIVLCSQRVGTEVVRLREGKTTLFVIGNGGDFPVVISRVGTLFMAGTNPEAVRGVVRRAHGSDEPNLGATPFYQQNRALLSGPGMSLALNAAALGSTLESLGGGFTSAQTEPLLIKLAAALRTLGSYAGVIHFEGQALRFTSRLNVNPKGGDAELAALLLNDTPAPAPTLAPAGSAALSAAHLEPQKVLNYLEGWAETGGVSLPELAQQQLGLDLDKALGWLGDELTKVILEPVNTDLNTLVYRQPQVLALKTTGRAATKAGLAELGKALMRGLEAQASSTGLPADLSAQLAQSSYRYGGTTITRLRVGPTFDLGTAFLGDTLLVGTPAAALEDVISTAQGYRRPVTDDKSFKQARTDAPQNVVSLNYHDVAAELRGLAGLMRVVAQPLAFTASVGLSQELKNADTPNFADLLHLADLLPNTLETLSQHTETLSGYTWIEGGAHRSETRLSLK